MALVALGLGARAVAFEYGGLQSGDLVFQTAGDSDFSKAIVSATEIEDSQDFVHVGIVWVTDGCVKVIEASPEEGVRVIGFEEFVAEAPVSIVKRLELDFPVEGMVERALNHIGEPYDWYYLPDNGRMYCSELVYESYLGNDGDHLFETVPMNFRDSMGHLPKFWKALYQNLGMDVPEGLPGTNPVQISKNKNLKTVFIVGN